MKQLLAAQEIQHPRVFNSIMAAIRPIMGINRTDVDTKTLIARITQDGDDEDEGAVDAGKETETMQVSGQ